ncbi:MAG: cysteine desulfurase family protein [Clostridium sp.]
MRDIVYLDNSATTKIYESSYETMIPYYNYLYGNPSAAYKFSINIKSKLENTRKIIAETLGVDKSEIFFTSGGTEANNWALKGICELLKNKGKHIITSKIEHKAIINTCKYLENKGFSVTYLNVDKYGNIDLNELESEIRNDTILVSIMYANNEVGTIMPIDEIAKITEKYNIVFHTDAVQAYGHININLKDKKVDMLSASSHKFHGPKGIGFLYVRKGINLPSFIHGGSQENGLRGGTENVPAIVGMGTSAKEINGKLNENIKNITYLRDYTIKKILSEIPNVILTGDIKKRLPNNVSFCILNIDSIVLINQLSKYNICISSGSACNTNSIYPSHVLLALGYSKEIAKGAIRISLSEFTTKKEIDYAVDKIKDIVNELREWM